MEAAPLDMEWHVPDQRQGVNTSDASLQGCRATCNVVEHELDIRGPNWRIHGTSTAWSYKQLLWQFRYS